MRSARIALVTALAAASILVASPAQARHLCHEEDPIVDVICESHIHELQLILKLYCHVSPSC